MNYALIRRLARAQARKTRWADSEIEQDLFQEGVLAVLRSATCEPSNNYIWARAGGAMVDYIRNRARSSHAELVDVAGPDPFADVELADAIRRLPERTKALLRGVALGQGLIEAGASIGVGESRACQLKVAGIKAIAAG